VVWLARNLVKALSWYSDVSEKLADPSYSGWFLQFDAAKAGNYSSSPCTEGVCSQHYHSQDQTPEHLVGRKECKDSKLFEHIFCTII
jgi:carbamoylphosphate synthase small subunit